MIKFITIGILLFLLYRLVFQSTLPAGKSREVLDDKLIEEDDYIDYEEID
ncbi:MAG: hypothetical protein AB8G15_06845 [Saprospiraceae bacterium]